MYKKKLLKGCLVATLAIAMAATSMSPVLSNGAAVVQAAEQMIIKVNFVDEAGNSLYSGDAFVDSVFNIQTVLESVQALGSLQGYKLDTENQVTGDQFASDYEGKTLVVKVVKDAEAEQPEQEVKEYTYITYVDETTGYTIAYGTAKLNEYGQFNAKDAQGVPEGYELVTVGDFSANADGSNVVLKVKKVNEQHNEYAYIQYVDATGNYTVGYGTVKLDKNGQFNTKDVQGVPEGYELVTVGDFSDDQTNAQGYVELKVQKIEQHKEYAYIEFVDADGGYTVAYGTVKLDENGHFNTKDVQGVPAGYMLTTVGDFSDADANADGNIVLKVKKVDEQHKEYAYIEYVDAEGGYTVGYGVAKLDKNGVFNTSSLTDVPAGYELTTVGDFSEGDANAAGNIVLKVQKVKQQYAYIKYVDADADYVVGYGVAKLDEDGKFNTSDLQDVPDGYELTTVGDFFANADGSDVVLKVQKVDKQHKEYAYIEYVDAEGGYTVGYGVAKLDENGIFNTSSLRDVPAGYELVTVGDFSDGDTNAEGNIVLKVQKKQPEYTYITYVDADAGYTVGYGVAKLDENGIFNTSSLQDVPEGYELVTVGDFFANADGSNVVLKVKKVDVQHKEYAYIEYVDAEGGYTVGYGVAKLDENGIFNTSSLQR